MIDTDAIVSYLTTGHLDVRGGYPFDFEWIDKTLVVAAVDESGRTSVLVYSQDEVARWVDEANSYFSDFNTENCIQFDEREAIAETNPK